MCVFGVHIICFIHSCTIALLRYRIVVVVAVVVHVAVDVIDGVVGDGDDVVVVVVVVSWRLLLLCAYGLCYA